MRLEALQIQIALGLVQAQELVMGKQTETMVEHQYQVMLLT
jgi:hypothetical protein